MSGPSTPAPFAGAELQTARDRSNRLLFSGAALGSIGHIAAVTIAVLAANELLENPGLAGAPNAVIIIGSAIGTSLLAALMLRTGRRIGLAAGYAVAVAGALVAVVAVIEGSFWLLLGSALLLGFGNSSNQLARYVAADMAPAARRARAIGLIVWAATIGAIIGPNIVPFAASISGSVGLPELAGPFLIPVLLSGAAAVLLFLRLRPDPYALAEDHARFDDEDTARGRPMREIVRRPVVLVALTTLIVGQVVMVVVMTMTPLHMTEHGHGLPAVGFVLSAHTAGMFAFSPVSGWMAQRLGNVPTILAGVGVLAISSVMASLAPPDGGAVLFAAMFLLGYGWNLGFVAGSALLTTGVDAGERTRTEGFTDTLVWGSSAVASLSSGIILAALGFSALGIVALFILVLPLWAIFAKRSAMAAPAGSSSVA